MKKRPVIIIFVAMIAIIALLSICMHKDKSSATIQSETKEEVVGDFYLFRTQDVQEYLNFLENFDENKYEIVDISTSYTYNYRGSDEFYMVTYKLLSPKKE